MGKDDKGNAKGVRKGFAGFSSMVSDVEATLEAATMSAPPARGHAGGASGSQSPPPTESVLYQESSLPPASLDAPSGWKWILGAVGVLGAIWLFSDSGNKPSLGSPTPYRASAPTRPAEELPPVGNDHVLRVAQIRYCLAEDIRIDAARGMLDRYDDFAVDRFNAMVSDYNSRCGSFMYKRGALESARRDVEAYRPALHNEGRVRFMAR